MSVLKLMHFHMFTMEYHLNSSAHPPNTERSMNRKKTKAFIKTSNPTNKRLCTRLEVTTVLWTSSKVIGLSRLLTLDKASEAFVQCVETRRTETSGSSSGAKS